MPVATVKDLNHEEMLERQRWYEEKVAKLRDALHVFSKQEGLDALQMFGLVAYVTVTSIMSVEHKQAMAKFKEKFGDLVAQAEAEGAPEA